MLEAAAQIMMCLLCDTPSTPAICQPCADELDDYDRKLVDLELAIAELVAAWAGDQLTTRTGDDNE